MDLSIIIPCYNEEESLPLLKKLLTEFKNKTSLQFECIFVDDGSKDKTYEMLNVMFTDFPYVTVIKNPTNLNLGGAVKAGIPACKGEYTAVIDADGSYSPLKLLEMYELAKTDNLDVVSASAHHPQAGFAETTPWWRVFLSRSVQELYNIVLGTKYCSYTSIFRLYRTHLLKSLKIESNNFMAMAEILSQLVLKNAKIVDFPAKSSYRQHGVSKAKIFQTIRAHIIYLFKLLFRCVKVN
jgi:glycosyltransferase involved in cell wall biosynthesis